jgi:hypothetical protein
MGCTYPFFEHEKQANGVDHDQDEEADQKHSEHVSEGLR